MQTLQNRAPRRPPPSRPAHLQLNTLQVATTLLALLLVGQLFACVFTKCPNQEQSGNGSDVIEIERIIMCYLFVILRARVLAWVLHRIESQSW